MADATAQVDERLCRSLTRHLIGRTPSAYVTERFARGLRSDTYLAGLRRGSADRVLDAVGRMGGPALSLADTYARFFAPAGEFRRRIILLAAILESSPDSFDAFEPPEPGRFRSWMSLAGSGVLFAIRLPLAILLIGPLHLGSRLAGPPGTDRARRRS